MKTLRLSNLKISENIDYGSYSDIFECKYNSQKYAYKAFFKPEKVLDKETKRKINNLSSMQLKGSVLPEFWIRDGIRVNGYLMKLYSFVLLEELEYEEKVKYLTNLKSSILELHENKIIHADIHDGNIINDKDEVFLVDFDNSSYKNEGTKYTLLNKNAKKFVETYGFNQELDIFLFNLLTYSIFTDVDYYDVVDEVNKNSTHGILDDYDCKDIIKSLTLKEKTFNNDFLIDRIK